jgi:SAM-dependent methyltransferase
LSSVTFTGERLHDTHALFGIDLARHRAAYSFATRVARGARVLDLGCGTGYGSAELAEVSPFLVAIDRIAPDADYRRPSLGYVRADLHGIPLAPQSFDLVVSFQVIEHLEDPTRYLRAIETLLRPGGTALIATPNVLQSDRENPFHVHEYEPDELRARLEAHFSEVEILGVGMGPAVAGYFNERLRQIRRIVRLDLLGLRHRMPRWLIERLFARLAVVVRRRIQQGYELPEATIDDFPIGPADEACLDLLAVCRGPAGGGLRG